MRVCIVHTHVCVLYLCVGRMCIIPHVCVPHDDVRKQASKQLKIKEMKPSNCDSVNVCAYMEENSWKVLR